MKFHRIALTLVALGALALGSASHLVAQAPTGSTAKCGDGTYSKAHNKQGACSNHKGVAEWYGTAEAAPAPTTHAKSTKPKSAAAPAGATGKCGDGTYTHAKSKQGACSNHGGVAEWMGGGEGEVPAANAGLPAGAPGDATALCNDNTYSNSQHREGTCSHHGGVKKWLKDVPK